MSADLLGHQARANVRVGSTILVADHPSAADHLGARLLEGFLKRHAGPYSFVEIIELLLNGGLYPRSGKNVGSVFIPIMFSKVLMKGMVCVAPLSILKVVVIMLWDLDWFSALRLAKIEGSSP